MTKRINQGRREREAGKRRGRGQVYSLAAGQSPLKLGKKKMCINLRKSFAALDRTSKHLSVADIESNA
jgi:hypothetical protein